MFMMMTSNPAREPEFIVHGWALSLRAAAQRYIVRRAEQAAIRELSALPDRLLHDIGISRSEIITVVRGGRLSRLHR
jgi:uncharacterized protein YjiS (DUF1127 family)